MAALHIVVAMSSLSMLLTSAVCGQDYPNKPIRILTGGAGGSNDSASRLVAQGISQPLGQSVIVENRPANLLPEIAAKAPPDGYTLLVIGNVLWLQPILRGVAYDPLLEFSPISGLGREFAVLTVHPSVPAKSVKELIALAAIRPGALNYSSGATGSSSHLAAELFKAMTGVNIVRVPYKNTGLAINGLLSGEVHLIFGGMIGLAPHVKSGRLRPLAITSGQPSALAPGLPTVAASGLPGYESGSMDAIFVPAKTPEAIIKRLNLEIVRVLSQADVKEKLLSTGIDVISTSPEQFAATMKADIAKWSKVIKDAGIKTE